MSPFPCPSCGKEIDGGPYCRFCGHQLDEQSAIQQADPSPEHPEVSVGFGFVLQGVDMTAITSLLCQVELDMIDDELDELIEQSRATRQALKLEKSDKSLLLARAEYLRDHLEQLKARRKELEHSSGRLFVEDLIDELIDMEDKLEKLERAEKTLDKEAFKEQHERLTRRIKDLKASAKTEIKTLRSWSKEIEKKKREFHKAQNKLDAQYKIGDVSRTAYEKSKAEFQRSIQILSVAHSRLDEIITDVKSRVS